MKILFLIPPYFSVDDLTNPKNNSVMPAFTIPYGMLSMEAYLKKNYKKKLNIKILDLNITLEKFLKTGKDDYLLYFEEEITKRLKNFQADIIGLSALFNTSNVYLKDLSDFLKKKLPSSLIIAGGGLPSAAYETILKSCPSIDAVCKGEGEIPMLDLLNSNDKDALIFSHKSWISRDSLLKNKFIGHSFVENLNDIPMLNYDLAEITDNFEHYNNRSIDKTYSNEKRQEMAIHTSRGCPFLCVFCSNPSLHGRKVRYMTIDRVVNEVKRMRDEYGMTVLLLEDDHFFNDKNRAKEILRRLATLKIRIEFPNGLAVYAIDDEMAYLLSKAGVSAVALAVESGSDYVLNKIIKKPLKKHLIKPAVENLRKYGVKSHVFIVCGLPGEKDEHRQETANMLIDTGFDWVHIFMAIPIYGSRLYDICVENGYIENTDSNHFVATKSVIRTKDIDPDKLAIYSYNTQLEVNFVKNHNMKIGNYRIALEYFENVIRKYPMHAFALFFSAECYRKINNLTKYKEYIKRFKKIINENKYWMEMSESYKILN